MEGFTMKRTTLLLILAAIAGFALAAFLSSCSTLRTERDVLRAYGKPFEIERDSSWNSAHVDVFKLSDGGTEKFGIRDSMVFFHLGF